MKCVIVIDQELPLGLIANTAAVLAMSIARQTPEIVGEDLYDQDGSLHRGITQANIPLLKSDAAQIAALRQRLVEKENPDLFFVDFCDAAQQSKHYADYRARLLQTPSAALKYLGVAIYGPTKQVDKFTGSLPLLR